MHETLRPTDLRHEETAIHLLDWNERGVLKVLDRFVILSPMDSQAVEVPSWNRVALSVEIVVDVRRLEYRDGLFPVRERSVQGGCYHGGSEWRLASAFQVDMSRWVDRMNAGISPSQNLIWISLYPQLPSITCSTNSAQRYFSASISKSHPR